MPKLARSRVKHLERLGNLDGPPIGRLLFLLPDLWPEPDRLAFADPDRSEALGNLVAWRTGVRPTFGMEPIWAITEPASETMLAMADVEKVAFLEQHETRPLRSDRWDWRSDASDDTTEDR